MLGARRSAEAIEKITWYLASAIAVLAFVANVVGSSASDDGASLRMSEQIQNQVYQIQDVSNMTAPQGDAAQEVAPSPGTDENE